MGRKGYNVPVVGEELHLTLQLHHEMADNCVLDKQAVRSSTEILFFPESPAADCSCNYAAHECPSCS